MVVLTANAHHATVANFTQEIIAVDGVIEQVRYQNPHSSILIKHTSEEGEETYWLIETGANTRCSCMRSSSKTAPFLTSRG